MHATLEYILVGLERLVSRIARVIVLYYYNSIVELTICLGCIWVGPKNTHWVGVGSDIFLAGWIRYYKN